MPSRKSNVKRSMRLDNALVANGLAPSRARARDAILRGHVMVDGAQVAKPSLTVSEQSSLEINDPGLAYVSRAAFITVIGASLRTSSR